MIKKRYDVISSSLGSYFGVGFNTPDEQLDIDLGITEAVFDDDAQDRMNLGIALEDACLNYFEQKLGIVITDRNTETVFAFDGMLKCKMDGMTVYEGVKTVVENKVSNSTMGAFTNNKGYYMQCQAYMEATGTEQCLLMGLYKGKPIYKLLKKDPEMIEDIKEMVSFVYLLLNGIESRNNYPVHLLEKYSGVKELLEPLENVTDEDKIKFDSLAEIKKQIKELQDQESILKEYLLSTFDKGDLATEDYKVAISERERKGGFDEDTFSIENPDFDVERYRKPSSKYREIRVTFKKPKRVE